MLTTIEILELENLILSKELLKLKNEVQNISFVLSITLELVKKGRKKSLIYRQENKA